MLGVLDQYRVVWRSGLAEDRDPDGMPVLGLLCHHVHPSRRSCLVCCREQNLKMSGGRRWQAWPFLQLSDGRELALRQQWSSSRLRLLWGKHLIASYPLDARGQISRL